MEIEKETEMKWTRESTTMGMMMGYNQMMLRKIEWME